MCRLGLKSTGGYKKSARTVGECWANVRRSGYPKLKSPAEYGFGQYLTGGTEIPVRLCYPVLESSYNKKSYNEAIERMGGTDNWHSLLWWDTEN
jgi:hypothetical protein